MYGLIEYILGLPFFVIKKLMSAEKRTIGFYSSFSLVVGSMLGVGIFLYPPIVAGHCSPLVYFLTWIFGGIIALAGAMACAELSTMMPHAGGDYRFQREALGPSVAFATGWVLFLGIFSGSIATMSVALFQYQMPALLGQDLSVPILSYPWGGSLNLTDLGACCTVVILSIVCKVGIRSSGRLQLLLTVVPIVFLFGFAAYALGSQSPQPAIPSPPKDSILGWVEAYLVVYFAYAGWNSIIYIAGDIQKPSKNIPKALIGGTLFTTALYLLLCYTFVHVLGYAELAKSIEAGTAVASTFGQPFFSVLMTALIALAILASINGTLMAGARTGYSMSRDGLFLNKKASQDHILLLQCIWSILLILTGRFESLTQLTSLAMLITGSITVFIVFLLRKTRPHADRPYRSRAYPIMPLLYLLCNIAVLGYVFCSAVYKTRILLTDSNQELWSNWKDWYPLFGLFLFVLAFAIHYTFSKKKTI